MLHDSYTERLWGAALRQVNAYGFTAEVLGPCDVVPGLQSEPRIEPAAFGSSVGHGPDGVGDTAGAIRLTHTGGGALGRFWVNREGSLVFWSRDPAGSEESMGADRDPQAVSIGEAGV